MEIRAPSPYLPHEGIAGRCARQRRAAHFNKVITGSGLWVYMKAWHNEAKTAGTVLILLCTKSGAVRLAKAHEVFPLAGRGAGAVVG
jgi:hypothetical protein